VRFEASSIKPNFFVHVASRYHKRRSDNQVGPV